jgi:hypothetical protein
MATILGRVVAPTAVTALVSSATAVIGDVVVNLAAEWKTNWAMWLAVAAATALSGAVALWLYQREVRTDPSPSAAATPGVSPLSTATTPLLSSRRDQRCLLAVGVLMAVSSAVVWFWPTGPATDLGPALGLIHSRCMQVTADDVSVFTDSDSKHKQTWTTWTTGTHFWADPDPNTLHRYRTTLRNGNRGWVTNDPRYVTSTRDCL